MKQSYDETLNRLVRRLSAEYDINAPPEAPQTRFSSFPHWGPELCSFPCLSLSAPPSQSQSQHSHFYSNSHSYDCSDSEQRQDHQEEGDHHDEYDHDHDFEQQQHQHQQQQYRYQYHHHNYHHNYHQYGATKRLTQSQHENFLFLLSRKTEYRQNQHSIPLASYSILRNIVSTFGTILEYQIQRMIYNIMTSTCCCTSTSTGGNSTNNAFMLLSSSSPSSSEGGGGGVVQVSEEDKEILRKFTNLPMGSLNMNTNMNTGGSKNNSKNNNCTNGDDPNHRLSSSSSSSLVVPELVYTNFSTMLPMEHWQEMGCDHVSLRLIFHAELTLRIIPNNTVHTATIRAPGVTHGVFTPHHLNLNRFRSNNTHSSTAGIMGGASGGVGNVRFGGVTNTTNMNNNTCTYSSSSYPSSSSSRANHNNRPESIEVDINTKALYNSIRRECKIISKKVINAIVGYELKKLREHQYQRNHHRHNYSHYLHLQQQQQPKVHKHHPHGHGHGHGQRHHYNHQHGHHKHSATMNSDGLATYKTDKTAVSTIDGRSNASTIYYEEPTSSGATSRSNSMDHAHIHAHAHMSEGVMASASASASGSGVTTAIGTVGSHGSGSSSMAIVRKSSDDVTPKKRTSRTSSTTTTKTTTSAKYHDPQYGAYHNHNEHPQGSGGGSDTKSIGSRSAEMMSTAMYYEQEDLTAADLMGYNLSSDGDVDISGANNNTSIIYEEERIAATTKDVGSKKKTKRKNWKRLISPQKNVDNNRSIVEQNSSHENMTEDESAEKKSKKKNDHRWKALFVSSKQ